MESVSVSRFTLALYPEVCFLCEDCIHTDDSQSLEVKKCGREKCPVSSMRKATERCQASQQVVRLVDVGQWHSGPGLECYGLPSAHGLEWGADFLF